MDNDVAFTDVINNPKSEVKGSCFVDDCDGAAKDTGCYSLRVICNADSASIVPSGHNLASTTSAVVVSGASRFR